MVESSLPKVWNELLFHMCLPYELEMPKMRKRTCMTSESGLSEARITEFFDTVKHIDSEIQDIQRRLTDIIKTLREIQEW